MITTETIAHWDYLNKNASNPLGVTEELVERSLQECPPRTIKGAKFLGRHIIPKTYVNFIEMSQSRDKNNDQSHVLALTLDFKVNGILLDRNPPIVAYNKDNPHIVEGLGGYHRNTTFSNLQQEIYMYDVYDFEGPYAEYYKEVTRNIDNAHLGVSKKQTKSDFVKVISNAIDRGIVDKDHDAIADFVDDIAPGETKNRKVSIVTEVAAGTQIYPNFRTYSSSKSMQHANTLSNWMKSNGFAPAGIENRSVEEIQNQGYIIYCAAEGDNMSTWARAIINSQKYGVPTYVIGYSTSRVDDLKKFREKWLDNFNAQKQIFIDFAKQSVGDIDAEIDGKNYPVKCIGFMPQYVKSNPQDRGAPTEFGLVSVDGVTIGFDGNNECLAENKSLNDEKSESSLISVAA